MYSGDEIYDDEITSGPATDAETETERAFRERGEAIDRIFADEAPDPLPDERGSGPDRYPTILRDSSGRPTDIG